MYYVHIPKTTIMEKTVEIVLPRSILAENGDGVLQLRIRFAGEEHSEATRQEGDDFLTLATNYLGEKSFGENYRRGILSLLRTLVRYERYRRLIRKDGFRLNLHTMGRSDVEDFRRYLCNEAVLAARYPRAFRTTRYPPLLRRERQYHIAPRGANTVTKYMKHFATMYQWLQHNGLTENDPFRGLATGGEHYGTPFYLTVEERNRVADFDLAARPDLAVQRDIFVFQCLVGCRVGDLLHLTQENVADGMLLYEPQKTRHLGHTVLVKVPLGQRAMHLIRRYGSRGGDGRLFPFIAARTYNAAIREVLRTCGIDRRVMVRNPKTGMQEMRPICDVASSHMARRTFVGATYRVVKDPAIVGRMSGHADGSRAFARYRNIDEDVLREVIEKIE